MAFKDMSQEERDSFQEELDKLFLDAVKESTRKYVGQGHHETVIDSSAIREAGLRKYGTSLEELARVNAYYREMPVLIANSIGKAVNDGDIVSDAVSGDADRYQVIFGDFEEPDDAIVYNVVAGKQRFFDRIPRKSDDDGDDAVRFDTDNDGIVNTVSHVKTKRAVSVSVHRKHPNGYIQDYTISSPVLDKTRFNDDTISTIGYVETYRGFFEEEEEA